MRLVGKLFTAFSLVYCSAHVLAAGKATHVVVVVWDGMRPDFISEKNCPTLWKLARHGVRFENHHPVYVSSTEVNGAALATGVYPEISGIIGNSEFRPALDPLKSVFTADLESIRHADQLNGNHFLGSPTLAEILHADEVKTVVAGAKPVTLLQDRSAGAETNLGIDVFAGKILPVTVSNQVIAVSGRFPQGLWTKHNQDRWTTETLIGPLWANGVPAFSLLWLREPDNSQHRTGPGSSSSLRAIRASDKNLAEVLQALERKGVKNQTDLIVVSDHGFSTISERVDLAAALSRSGFTALRKCSAQGLKTGEVLVVGNGGSAFLYVAEHQQELIQKIVRWLQAQLFSGVILTRKACEGTFLLESAKINTPDAPDIVLSFRWSPDLNGTGTPGLLCSDATAYSSGKGMHASLSRFDMHNTCIAAGPDFRLSFEDHFPTGNIDIAPTVLWILGVQPKKPLSGRVLTEAMEQSETVAPAIHPHRQEADYRAAMFTWHQYLNFSEVDGVIYLDEGNGEQIANQNVLTK